MYLREADNCFFGDDFILKFMKRLSFLMDAGIIVENNNYNYLLLAFYIGIMAFYDEDITDYIDKLNEELIEMLNEFMDVILILYITKCLLKHHVGL